MKKLKYIAPVTKQHYISASSFLNSSTLQVNSAGPHSTKNASTDAASRLGSPICDEEEAEEDETGY